MNKSTASIVIPVFNRAHLVHRAIDSALAQTHPCEVLVVDHGSTDDIESVIRGYGDRIRYIRKDSDNGPIAAWRDGVEQATGEYLHFTYDDDWIHPEFMHECISLFSDDIAFVYSRAIIADIKSGTEKKSLMHPKGKQNVALFAKHLLTTDLTISPGCAVFRRRDVLKNLLPYVPGANGAYGTNSGVGEDALLFLLTTLTYQNYVHTPRYLAFFLAHEGSITISAILDGKKKQLKESYRHAKNYYLQNPGAVKNLSYLEKIIHKINWAATTCLS